MSWSLAHAMKAMLGFASPSKGEGRVRICPPKDGMQTFEPLTLTLSPCEGERRKNSKR